MRRRGCCCSRAWRRVLPAAAARAAGAEAEEEVHRAASPPRIAEIRITRARRRRPPPSRFGKAAQRQNGPEKSGPFSFIRGNPEPRSKPRTRREDAAFKTMRSPSVALKRRKKDIPERG